MLIQWPKWSILLRYGSCNTRRIDFLQVDGSQRTPGFWGVTQPVGLGHKALKAFVVDPSDRARVSRQSAAAFLFSFLFLFLLEDTLAFFSWGP